MARATLDAENRVHFSARCSSAVSVVTESALDFVHAAFLTMNRVHFTEKRRSASAAFLTVNRVHFPEKCYKAGAPNIFAAKRRDPRRGGSAGIRDVARRGTGRHDA